MSYFAKFLTNYYQVTLIYIKGYAVTTSGIRDSVLHECTYMYISYMYIMLSREVGHNVIHVRILSRVNLLLILCYQEKCHAILWLLTYIHVHTCLKVS